MNFEEHIINNFFYSGVNLPQNSIKEFIKCNPVSRLNTTFDEVIDHTSNKLNPFAKFLERIYLSELLFTYKGVEDLEISFKSEILKKYNDSILIEIFSNYYLGIFEWNLNRREWVNANSLTLKFDFLNNEILSVKSKLNAGGEGLIEDTISILLEYYKFVIFEGLENDSLVKSMSNLSEKSPYEAAKGINTITDIFHEMKSEEEFISAIEPYRPIISQRINGLVNVDGRFNHIFIGVVESKMKYLSILESYLKSLSSVEFTKIEELQKTLETQNFEGFILIIKSLFATIPTVLIKNTTEAYYHIFIHLILKLASVDFESEVNTNIGRIDGVITLKNYLLILEFKMDTNNDGMEQILNRKYYERYEADHKNIILMSVSFSKKYRNITEYEVKKYK